MPSTPRKMELLRLLFLLPFLSAALSSCDPSQPHLLSLAFTSVSGFRLPLLPDCGGCLRDLRLPSQNLSGTVSWMFLRNITTLETVDLSGNSLEGSIPGGFWSAPALAAVNLAGNLLGGHLRFDRLAVRSSLRALNLSGNRFTGATGLSWHYGLQVLDLSGNSIALVPMGLRSLVLLQYLDLSGNFMAGEFPGDFPAIAGLRHLNLSSNNFTGTVDSESLNKFGVSAFVNTGSNLSFAEASFAQKQRKKNKHSKALIAILSAAALIASAITGVLWFLLRRKKWEKVSKKTAAVVAKVEWVAEARWEAPVVVFQKPLMELTFADMVEATSGFGRESLLAEGWRRGPLYRAVLPGEMNVVVRVLDSAAPTEETAAAAAFREIGRLRHPNLLPLLGYCICGNFFE
ncbi:putative LRR receptor-like serine/threonine-protein kinase [Apostasia shenzhenica]|uniref:Putative LRR receptor-like serine/threonine-protein kinase n=1 Tax=Apostasia shenzhenica TaxID=1088818 RepID=A0A2I0AQW2_9ASPA|nr:putative LRR receptor-like serine/threonine-protein kinase [Apostasia shenzhenica]